MKYALGNLVPIMATEISLEKEVPKELQFKVLVIGEFGVGKTAVIRRYTQGHFSGNYKVTIGVDFAVKNIEYDKETRVTLQLWDIAGHERFGSLTSVYYKYATAAIVVFDLSRPESFMTVSKWVDDVRVKVVLFDGKKIPIILLANKCDVEGIVTNPAIISNFCHQNDIDHWFLTSAKEDINIDIAMDFVVKKIFENRSSPPSALPTIQLSEPQNKPPEKPASLCCR